MPPPTMRNQHHNHTRCPICHTRGYGNPTVWLRTHLANYCAARFTHSGEYSHGTSIDA